MGTRGLIGFIQKGVYKGVYNHFDSYPSGLGDDIIKFILAHTDEELEEMRVKVEQLEGIDEHKVERLDEPQTGRWWEQETFKILHIPSIPRVTRDCYDKYRFPKKSPAKQAQAFRKKNRGFPADVDDDEILKRYLPARFPESVASTFRVLSWIPATGEVIETSQQHNLLERIWDGRDRYVVDEGYNERRTGEAEYCYWIDFENKVMEVDGMMRGATLIVPFKDLKVGALEKQAKLEEMKSRIQVVDHTE